MLLRARWAAVSTVLDTTLRLESLLPIEGAKQGWSCREAREDRPEVSLCVWSAEVSFTSAVSVITLLLVAAAEVWGGSAVVGPFGSLRRSALLERERLMSSPERRSLWDAATFSPSSSP